MGGLGSNDDSSQGSSCGSVLLQDHDEAVRPRSPARAHPEIFAHLHVLGMELAILP